MSMEVAEYVVNDMKMNLAGLVRAIVSALKDGKVSPFEGVMLGMKGMQLGTSVMMMLQSMDTDPDQLEEICNLLEKGKIVATPELLAA